MKLTDVIEAPPAATAMEGLEEVAKLDPVVWSMLSRRVKGQPLIYDNAKLLTEESLGVVRRTLLQSDFENELHSRLLHHRPFLKQPLRDKHKHKVLQKGRQVGGSEVMLSEEIHFLAKHDGVKCVHCVPEEAEILTRDGWKRYDEITKSDETLALDPETHDSRWEPILDVKAWNWSGELHPVGPFMVTDEHRWPTLRKTTSGGEKTFVKEVVRTNELTQAHTLIRHAPHVCEEESILSPRLARILGWVCTDGHQSFSGHGQMIVSQSKKKHLVEIEKLLGNKRKPTSIWTEKPAIATGPRGGKIVGYNEDGEARYGDVYSVRVKKEDVKAILSTGYKSKADLTWLVARLSHEAREVMFDAMMKADGCWSGPRLESRFFAKQDPRVRDGFQALCALLGKAANLIERGAYIIEPDSRSARMRAIYPKAKKEKYKGIVWCPRTKSGTWYMRWRGKVTFTGNTFPRDKQLTDFSITRIASMFAESPRMAALAGTPNQVFTKKIGNSYLIMRSAWESNLGEGVDADMVILDEKDRMRDKVELAFRESLKSSKYGYLRELSTPTLPGQGINLPFADSDQQIWLVKCGTCGLDQEIEWNENIIQVKDFPLGTKELPAESYEYLCRKKACRGKLDRIFSGRWVPRFPNRNLIRGYHLPQFIAPWISATRVMQDKIDFRFPEAWFCYVAGLPAVGSLEMVTDEDFASICAGHQFIHSRDRDWSAVSVGIDWGFWNWVVVLGRSAINQRLYILDIGMFEDSSEALKSAFDAEKFIMPFEPEIVIADAGYGKDRNAYLMRKLCPQGNEGRFYAQQYNPNAKGSRTFQPEWSDPTRGRVLVDRTIQLKNLVRVIKEREFGIPHLGIDKVQLLMKHIKSLTPFREIDDDSKEIIETVRSNGEDHLAHALGSAILGMEKLGKHSKFGFDLI